MRCERGAAASPAAGRKAENELPIAPQCERKKSMEGDEQKRIYDYPVVSSEPGFGPDSRSGITDHSQSGSRNIQENINKEAIALRGNDTEN